MLRNNKYNTISLAAAIKRKNSNSFLLKKRKHILAREFGLSVQTFCKYFDMMQEEGWVREESNGWRIVSFKDIMQYYTEDTGLYFGRYGLLKGKSHNFYDVKKELMQLLFRSNVVDRQLYGISKKEDLRSGRYRTVKQAIKRMRYKYPGKSADEILEAIDHNIRTSARQVAGILGISVSTANRMLNSLDIGKRQILVEWEKGIQPGKKEYLKQLYPKATIIPMPFYNQYKICLGSRISVNSIA